MIKNLLNEVQDLTHTPENCDCEGVGCCNNKALVKVLDLLADKINNEKLTKFNSGAIRDTQEGKTDFVETISFTAHERFARYMTSKKSKYGSGNFKKGIPIASYEQSLLRHIDKYFRNKYENGQDEPKEDHLAGIRFNVDGIMHEEEMARLKVVTTSVATK